MPQLVRDHAQLATVVRLVRHEVREEVLQVGREVLPGRARHSAAVRRAQFHEADDPVAASRQRADEPPLADYGEGQAAACHHPRNLDGKQIASAQLAPDSPESATETLPSETERVPAATR